MGRIQDLCNSCCSLECASRVQRSLGTLRFTRRCTMGPLYLGLLATSHYDCPASLTYCLSPFWTVSYPRADRSSFIPKLLYSSYHPFCNHIIHIQNPNPNPNRLCLARKHRLPTQSPQHSLSVYFGSSLFDPFPFLSSLTCAFAIIVIRRHFFAPRPHPH